MTRRRHGADATYEREVHVHVGRYVDKLLDGADLQPWMTLADIGCGEGAVAFRAIERTGPSLRVVLADKTAKERKATDLCKVTELPIP